jgi:hypothetical protein
MKRCRIWGAAPCYYPFQCCKQSRLAWHVWRWIAAFVAMTLTDGAWALYVASVKFGSPVAASLWAVALFVLGALAVIGYTQDRWLLLPGSVGAFTGTWVVVALKLAA